MPGIFAFISKELSVLLVSLLPGVELRGAVPLGVSLGMTPVRAFLLSYVGSLIPAVPVVLLIRPVIVRMAKSRYLQRFGHWLEQRSLRRSQKIQQYQALGLLMFVSIPLPGTGVWTGAMIAGLLRMRLMPAFWAIATGNLVAGLIVTFLSKQFI